MTILIKNILLIDGSGRPPAKIDVIVKNEKIGALGYFPRYGRADEVIDGLGGAYLAPGFIDINTSADLYLNLFSNPSQDSFLLDGVTTIIGGQSGISLAPLLYGALELNKFWSNPLKVNVNWHSVEEFLDTMSKIKFGVNFGTLAGHSTIRNEIIGDDFRDLTLKEVEVLKYIAGKSISEGAFGISFDLNFPLASLTPYKEIRTLLEVVEKHKGLFSVKLRNVSDATAFPENLEDSFSPAINEILNFSKETGVKTQINNFSCLKGLEGDYIKSLDLISENSANADIYFDIHPHEASVLPLFSFLPSWAKRGSFKEMTQNLWTKEFIAKIKKDIPAIKGENIIIFNAPGFEYLIGKSIKSFSQERGLTAKDGLLELMKITKLRASVVYKNLSVKTLPTAVTNDRSIISSSAGGFPIKHRNFGLTDFPKTFSKIIERSLKGQLIPIESVVKKMTSLPAQRIGLKNRGIIKEGYFADLVLFRDSGVETVLVNGKIAVIDGQFTDARGGKVLRKENF